MHARLYIVGFTDQTRPPVLRYVASYRPTRPGHAHACLYSDYRLDQTACAKMASYRLTRPGHACTCACIVLYRPDQTTCSKIASYRPDHARAPVVIYRPDQTRPPVILYSFFYSQLNILGFHQANNVELGASIIIRHCQ